MVDPGSPAPPSIGLSGSPSLSGVPNMAGGPNLASGPNGPNSDVIPVPPTPPLSVKTTNQSVGTAEDDPRNPRQLQRAGMQGEGEREGERGRGRGKKRRDEEGRERMKEGKMGEVIN